eukprot:gb/GECG01009112.1/.p1 GENE.gb/GECG01009112.1/~~gb/GECG01009112.1/.p1  ORF type:complete len:270 (+),score=20.04 gb/GECG01009112.1/:1-810(+)
MTSKGMPPRVIAEHEVSKNVQGGEGADYIRDVFTNNPLISQRFELHDGKEKGLPPFIDMVASSIVAETGVNALVLLRLRNKARYSSYLVEAAAVDACFPDVLNCRFVRQRTAHVTVIRTLWIPVRTKVKVLLWANNRRDAWSHESLVNILFNCAPLTRRLLKPCVVQWTDDRYLPNGDSSPLDEYAEEEKLRRRCSIVYSLLTGRPYPSSEYDYSADKTARDIHSERLEDRLWARGRPYPSSEYDYSADKTVRDVHNERLQDRLWNSLP